MASVVLAFAISAGVVALVRRHAERVPKALPDARGLHDRPMPRIGGIAILAGALPAALMTPPALPGSPSTWLACLAAVALVSLADDVRGVPIGWRLAVHLGAAAMVGWLVFGAGIAAVVATLAIAWAANLYNFMDGSDGLAGAMAVTGFSAYALVALAAGAPWSALAAVAAAAIPFLLANRPPAALFMGDVGALPLGFAAGALGTAGVAMGLWDAWFPLLVFLPFVADATLTLAMRVARGERVWEPHCGHFYQRLNLAGAGHRGTLAIYAAAMLACAALAVVCAIARPQAGWSALAVAVLAHLGGFGAIVYHVRNKARGTR